MVDLEIESGPVPEHRAAEPTAPRGRKYVIEKVSSLRSEDKTTVADALDWLASKAKTGEIPSSSARLQVTSIRNLTACLSSDEPREVVEVLRMLPELGRRWQNLNQDKQSDTAAAYISRAKKGLTTYLDWVKDPVHFKFDQKTRRPTKTRPSRKPRQGAASTSSETPKPAPDPDPAIRSYPTAGGNFRFVLPEDGIDARDVMKLACHLLTFASDFDPTAHAQARMFAMAKKED